jgi:hypothetical protein
MSDITVIEVSRPGPRGGSYNKPRRIDHEPVNGVDVANDLDVVVYSLEDIDNGHYINSVSMFSKPTPSSPGVWLTLYRQENTD